MKVRWLRIHSNKTETVLMKMGARLKMCLRLFLSSHSTTLSFSAWIVGSPCCGFTTVGGQDYVR